MSVLRLLRWFWYLSMITPEYCSFECFQGTFSRNKRNNQNLLFSLGLGDVVNVAGSDRGLSFFPGFLLPVT